MKRFLSLTMVIMFFYMIFPLPALAEVEWETQQVLNFKRKPVDVAVSARGSYLFVLTDDGIIHVYDSNGEQKGRIEAGKHVDKIACGSNENILLLKDSKSREIRKIKIDFIQDIDIKGSPYKGNKDAPVVIVVFTDYQCPYCARLVPTLDQVIADNRDNVKLVIKNFPLPMHSYAKKAAEASLAAYSMGKFWEFHDALFKNSKQLNDKKVREIATSLGLDPDELERKMNSKEVRKKINRDKTDADKVDVRGTPTIFINGRKLRDRSVEGFQDVIDTMLKKKR